MKLFAGLNFIAMLAGNRGGGPCHHEVNENNCRRIWKAVDMNFKDVFPNVNLKWQTVTLEVLDLIFSCDLTA